MRNIYLLFCLGLIVFNASSVNADDELKIKKKLGVITYTRDDVKKNLKQIGSNLKKAVNDEDILITEIDIITRDVQNYCKHPFIESDTGYSRAWYKKLYSITNAFYKAKLKEKWAKDNLKTKMYQDSKEKLRNLLDQFNRLRKRPMKVDSETLKDLRKKHRRARERLLAQLEKEAAQRKKQQEKLKAEARKKKSSSSTDE